jgi:drug/metabolite transporter (DMT)-like permease
MLSWTLFSFGITSMSVLSWSLFDATRKQLIRRSGTGATQLSVALAISQVPFYLVWSLWEKASWPSAGYWLPGCTGIWANAAASVLFIKALAAAPLSKSIPMLSFSPVFAAAMGWVTLNESPGSLPMAGMALITCGSFLLNATARSIRNPLSLIQPLFSDMGCRLMLGVSALWALASLSDKAALQHAPLSLHAFLQVSGVSAALIAVLLLRKQRLIQAAEPARYLIFWTALACVLSALTFQMLAIQNVQVGLFEGYKRAGGIVLSIIFGTLFFKERLTRPHLAAVIVMTFGSVLLFL